MEIRTLRDGEQDACLDLWGAAFPDTGRAYFVKYFTRDASWRPDDTVVCVVDDRIVSGATFVRRTVGCGDAVYQMGGVANVGTLPEHRGRGHSTAVLRALIDRMDAAGMDFSLLGTGIPGFYARLGYAVLPCPYLSGAPVADAPGAAAVRPATGDDLPRIHAWHAATNAGRPIAAARDHDAWTRWLNLRPETIPDGLLVGEGGYLWVGFDPDERHAHLREIGGEPDAIPGLLAAATRRAHAQGAVRHDWDVPLDPPVRAAAAALLTDLREERHGGLMWRAQRTALPDFADAARAPIWWGADGF